MAKSITRFKANAQRVHFKRRLKERYGIEINRETYDNIVTSVLTGRRVKVVFNGHSLNLVASWRARQSHRVKIYALVLEGIEGVVPVAFDSLRKELVTTHPGLLQTHGVGETYDAEQDMIEAA